MCCRYLRLAGVLVARPVFPKLKDAMILIQKHFYYSRYGNCQTAASAPLIALISRDAVISHCVDEKAKQ